MTINNLIINKIAIFIEAKLKKVKLIKVGMVEKILTQVSKKIEICINGQNGATQEQLQDILMDVNILKSYMGIDVNMPNTTQRKLLKDFLEHIEDTIDYLPCDSSLLIDDYFESI